SVLYAALAARAPQRPRRAVMPAPTAARLTAPPMAVPVAIRAMPRRARTTARPKSAKYAVLAAASNRLEKGVMMTGFKKAFHPLVIGTLALGFASSLAGADRVALAPAWEMDKSQSSLVFKGSQMGKAFEGQFAAFDAEIHFAPDMLEASSVSVTIQTASID